MKMYDLINEVNVVRAGKKAAKGADDTPTTGTKSGALSASDEVAARARAREAKRQEAEAGKGKTDTGGGETGKGKTATDSPGSTVATSEPKRLTKKQREAAARQKREAEATSKEEKPAKAEGEKTGDAETVATTDAGATATKTLPDYIDTTLFGSNPPRPNVLNVLGRRAWDEKYGKYLDNDGNIKPEFRTEPTGSPLDPLDGPPTVRDGTTTDAPTTTADAPTTTADAPTTTTADAPRVDTPDEVTDTKTWREIERDVETRGGKTFDELAAERAEVEKQIAAAKEEIARMKELSGSKPADAPRVDTPKVDTPRVDTPTTTTADAPTTTTATADAPASTISVDNAAAGERSFMDRALDKTGDLAGKYVKKLGTDPVKTLGTTYAGTGVVANTLGNTLDDKYPTFGQAVGAGLKDTFVDPVIGLGKALLPDTVVNKLNKKFNTAIDDKPETPAAPTGMSDAELDAQLDKIVPPPAAAEPAKESISTILKLSGQRPITERDNTVGITKPRAIRTLTENTNLAECGMGMSGSGNSQPASFSINASAGSGDEVANMLKSIMHLAGVKPVSDDMLGAEIMPHIQGIDIISANPNMSHDEPEVIELEGEMDSDEHVGEEYDNTPNPKVDSEDPLRKWANVINKNDMSTIPPGAPGDNRLPSTLNLEPVREDADIHSSLLKAYEAFKNS